MYAVLSSGGKQYRVEPGTTLLLERVAGEPGAPGASITFDRVLLVADGDDVMVGTPTVSGASITGTILREELGPKIVVFKFKQKIKYRRRTGHRQHLVRIRIDEISANGKSVKAEVPAPEKAEARPKRAKAPKAEAAEPEVADTEAADTEKAESTSKTRAKPKATRPKATKPKPTKAESKAKPTKAESKAKPKAKADTASAKADEKAEKPKARSRAKPRSKPKADKE